MEDVTGRLVLYRDTWTTSLPLLLLAPPPSTCSNTSPWVVLNYFTKCLKTRSAVIGSVLKRRGGTTLRRFVNTGPEGAHVPPGELCSGPTLNTSDWSNQVLLRLQYFTDILMLVLSPLFPSGAYLSTTITLSLRHNPSGSGQQQAPPGPRDSGPAPGG